MSARAAFTQTDVKKAAKGVADAGLKVRSVEIMPDGRILVLTGDAPEAQRSSLDEWKARHGRLEAQRA